MPLLKYRYGIGIHPSSFFGEIQGNENVRWSWNWTSTSDGEGIFAIFLTLTTSDTNMYCDLQKLLNVDTFKYEMDLGFRFPEHSNISVPPLKIISEVQVRWLIQLNKDHRSLLYVTSMRKNIHKSEHEVSDEVDCNVDDFWNTMEVTGRMT